MRDEQKQENSGENVVQIHGDRNTVNHHQHTHHHQHSHAHQHIVHAHGPVVIHTLVQQQAPLRAASASRASSAQGQTHKGRT